MSERLQKWLEKIKNFLKFEHRLWPPNKEGAKELGGKLLYLGGVLLIFIALLFAWYAKDLPTPNRVKNMQIASSSQITDRNGTTLYDVFGTQNRIMLEPQDVPDNMKKATIATEDKNFYKHHGVSFTGIMRAAARDVIHLKVKEGGSTITQQLIKNTLLSPKRTLSRKIKELILALEVEVMFNKDQILTMYLNAIPYGSNAYGIEAASETFFNKKAKDLSLAETAYLVAMGQAPTYYSPYGSHVKELETRKNYVLDQMTNQKYISTSDAEKAKTEKVAFAEYHENIKAPHFVMYVKEKLVEEYGEKMVNEGGLKVTTTLDLPTQDKAQAAMDERKDRVVARGGSNAALVAIDPKTGQIISMVGSFDYFNKEIDGQVNVADSERQPGSSFKPVVYATVFKNEKYNPAYPLYDLKTDFGGGYIPENYNRSFVGPISMRDALAQSKNVPAVKTLALAGLDNTLKTAKDFGMTTLNDPKRYGLSLVLGGGEVKLTELTAAYGVFANQGKYAPTTTFLKVVDAKGNVLYEYKDQQKNVLDPQIAYEISDILSDTGARAPVFGSIPYMTVSGHKTAVKTGTTQNYRDGWTIGYTPSLVTGVWTGNNNNSPMHQGSDGSMVAAPIWQAFMNKALADKKDEDFQRPKEIKNIAVDFLSNKIPTDNSTQIINGIFASWQVPKEKDNVHVKYKICTLDGKLASDQTPTQYIEEKVFADIHSEQPKLSNWEGPVRSWAASQGLLNPPPTETTDLFTDSTKPKVTFTAPANGASVSGSFTISATATTKYEVSRVEFFIDNVSIGIDVASPFSITFDASKLSPGSHSLVATVYDQYNQSASDTININVARDTTAPNITNVLSGSITANSATITWNTNEGANSIVEYGLDSALGNVRSDNVMTTSHSVSLTGLQSGKIYYFRTKSADSIGNTSQGSILSFSTH